MIGKLWGGRFEKEEMDPFIMRFTSSINVDKVLAKYDCFSSKVHVDTLVKGGYLTRSEAADLKKALDTAENHIDEGSVDIMGFEDIHSAIQDFVEGVCPESGKKLHTARSRNEQVVNDVRLYCKDSVERIRNLIAKTQISLVKLGLSNTDVIVPGYTHLNRAQPVLFAHLLLAYVEMLSRDAGRLEDASARAGISVMGSGAIAGSALNLDRIFTAGKMGFGKISANSIDSVSDRDFIIEIVSALSILAVHLSRIADDFILYSVPEFGFIEIGMDFCTGSSLMPQKKNPDVLELIRGRAAGVVGALNTLFVLLKGLPHSYNRDLQEDKKPLFESVETMADCLDVMGRLAGGITVRKDNGRKALEDEFIYATDIAEYLVAKGVAFKTAHETVGAIVKKCIDDGINISDLSITELKGYSEQIDEDIYGLLNPETSVKNKKTEGSTNPDMVLKALNKWKKQLRG
jgi:argininosuccinate lyase